MDNRTVAQRLFDHANQLAAEPGNLFRSRAYRQAAQIVLGLDASVSDLITHEGRRGLERLPGIGSHISQTIEALVSENN